MGLFSNLSFRKRSQPEPAVSVELPEASAQALVAEPAPAMPVLEATSAAGAQAHAEELVQRVVQELPTFLTVAVVETATGKILAGQWAGHSGGAVDVALAHAELVRQTQLAIEALQLSATEQLADILITLRHQLHLLRVLPLQGWLLYLAVRAQDTNPALARSVLQVFDNE